MDERAATVEKTNERNCLEHVTQETNEVHARLLQIMHKDSDRSF